MPEHPSFPTKACTGNQRRPVRVRRVDECRDLDEVFQNCLPAFGGAYLRRIYGILDRAILSAADQDS